MNDERFVFLPSSIEQNRSCDHFLFEATRSRASQVWSYHGINAYLPGWAYGSGTLTLPVILWHDFMYGV